MHVDRVDALIRFILSRSANTPRGLGVLHVMHYLYLADCHHGTRHGGTFTGLRWRAWYFGAWSVSAYVRINQLAARLPVDNVDVVCPASQVEQLRFVARAPTAGFAVDYEVLGDEMRRVLSGLVQSLGDDTQALVRYALRTGPLVWADAGAPLGFQQTPATWPSRPRAEPVRRGRPLRRPRRRARAVPVEEAG